MVMRRRWMAALLLMILAAEPPADEPPGIQQVLPFDVTVCFAGGHVDGDPVGVSSRPKTRYRLAMRAGWNVGAGRDRPYHEIYVSIQSTIHDGHSANLLGYCSDYERDDLASPLPGLLCDLACADDAVAIDAIDTDTIVISGRGLRTACHEPKHGSTVDAMLHLQRQPPGVCAELENLPVDEAGIEGAYRRARAQAQFRRDP